MTVPVPVSVIVPHQEHRKEFFWNYVLPSIELNAPRQIIVEPGDGTPGVKRNRGAAKASSEFLFFCDDDCTLLENCLSRLILALTKEGESAGYAYCDYVRICSPGYNVEGHDPIEVVKSRSFDGSCLRGGNFVSSMSLVRKSVFDSVRFREDVECLEDWILWLDLLDRGVHGVYIPEVLFYAYYFDAGVTWKLSKGLIKAPEIWNRNRQGM